jgi:hypothetical protein
LKRKGIRWISIKMRLLEVNIEELFPKKRKNDDNLELIIE